MEAVWGTDLTRNIGGKFSHNEGRFAKDLWRKIHRTAQLTNWIVAGAGGRSQGRKRQTQDESQVFSSGDLTVGGDTKR